MNRNHLTIGQGVWNGQVDQEAWPFDQNYQDFRVGQFLPCMTIWISDQPDLTDDQTIEGASFWSLANDQTIGLPQDGQYDGHSDHSKFYPRLYWSTSTRPSGALDRYYSHTACSCNVHNHKTLVCTDVYTHTLPHVPRYYSSTHVHTKATKGDQLKFGPPVHADSSDRYTYYSSILVIRVWPANSSY
jgi:hypothetical protein